MPRVSDVDAVAPESSPPIIVENTPTSAPAPNRNVTDKVYEIFGHTTHPLSSSLIFPKLFSFAERDDNETILIALRPHWFTNFSWILLSVLLLISPLFFKFIPFINNLPGNYRFIFSYFWYLVTLVFSFEKFLSWYFDVYIVTNLRVIDVDFYNLLTKKFSEAEIAKIQDVTTEFSGVSQSIFNYGNVLIQTASEIDEITFTKVPNPAKVVKIIQELSEKGGGK